MMEGVLCSFSSALTALICLILKKKKKTIDRNANEWGKDVWEAAASSRCRSFLLGEHRH